MKWFGYVLIGLILVNFSYALSVENRIHKSTNELIILANTPLSNLIINNINETSSTQQRIYSDEFWCPNTWYFLFLYKTHAKINIWQ